MTIEHLQLLRNIGQFDSVASGAQLALSKLTLIYAENGRGKTTLATVFRSVGNNDPQLVLERKRLGAPDDPHIVLRVDDRPIVFEDGEWSVALPNIAVFDDYFVAENVCSGMEIGATHRQNLHELILGAQGVALNRLLQEQVVRIEEHNRALRQKESVIGPAIRGNLSVDQFCALPRDPDIDNTIIVAERNLSVARSAEAVQQYNEFAPFTVPAFDITRISALLARTLPDLQAEAAERVSTHLLGLGEGGEVWVGEGMSRIASRLSQNEHTKCPFCAQDLSNSSLVRHYQAYFSEAYEVLKATIDEVALDVDATHGGEAATTFERWVRTSEQGCAFWGPFVDTPTIDLDTVTISNAWLVAREAVLSQLHAKAAAPLEPMALSQQSLEAIQIFDNYRAMIDELSAKVQACNGPIRIAKERAAVANLEEFATDLANAQAVRARHTEAVAALCESYMNEMMAKEETETRRTEARNALDLYRQNIFPVYQTSINTYLQRFTAGFRLESVNPVNTRSGSSCTYSVLINNVPILPTAEIGPSFRNTLSSGDRNTLALAFFFASLEQDPGLSQKIVVFDDPMTSLDEHRSLTTVQEMRRMLPRVRQIIVLSHSKPFLCGLWEGAVTSERSAVVVQRDGNGSTLANWDVNRDCITEHDRRHELVRAYLEAADPLAERNVAMALRPIIEVFLRIAYPALFRPGNLVGPFINACKQRVGSANEILAASDIDELENLLDFANKFHHDTNPAWATAAINDQELIYYCKRTLNFTRRA
ncbi:MAG: AAA family ATPase [Alphaproteobacteria bacterium]